MPLLFPNPQTGFFASQPIYLLSSFWFHMRFPGKKVWIQISRLKKKLVDQDPTIYHAASVMLHGFDLIYMIVTKCFHILNVA